MSISFRPAARLLPTMGCARLAPRCRSKVARPSASLRIATTGPNTRRPHALAARLRCFSTTVPAWKRSGSEGDGGVLQSELEDADDWSTAPPTLSPAVLAGVSKNLARLRDACSCEICVDKHSGQKRFSTSQIPQSSKLAMPKIDKMPGAGGFRVVWEKDFMSGGGQHVSRYSPAEFFVSIETEQGLDYNDRMPHVVWDGGGMRMHPLKKFKFHEWVRGEGRMFRHAFSNLVRMGIIFLRDVPQDEAAVEDVAQAMGPIYDTFYGRTWDVVSKPAAENVAYTDEFLCLHQDLMYFKSPPKLQLLHCLENEAEGGESLFVDGFRAADFMATHYPAEFTALCKYDVYYHYTKRAPKLSDKKPVFAVRNGAVTSLAWAPPFQGSQDVSNRGVTFDQFLAAAKVWEQKVLAQPDLVFRYKMQPGECVVFDNTRVLHGRAAFDPSTGHRWLKGTYLSTQAYRTCISRVIHEARVAKVIRAETAARAEERTIF